MSEVSVQDHLDRILEQWRLEKPDLDCYPMTLFGRIARLQTLLARQIENNFKNYGLSLSDFDVLATLRRSGPPYCLRPTELYKSAMLSSGTMTSRLDKLEKMALITRLPDPKDRRSLQIKLCQKGIALTDEVVVSHVQLEKDLMASLSTTEQENLNALLKNWLLSLGDQVD